MDYYHHSIELILQNQNSSGAYIASPAFPNYHYCWLRDGSFIAYAMDRAGEYKSADAFFKWVDRAINKYSFKVKMLEEQMKEDPLSPNKSILHTRYTLGGEEESTDSTWGNFQIDGYGTWLWALAEHVRLTGNYALLSDFTDSIDLTLRYLKATWQLPNYDCWEEHPEYLHPYSLAAVFGGVKATADLVADGRLILNSIPVATWAAEVKDFLDTYAIFGNKFVKHIWPVAKEHSARSVENSSVDSSLIGLSVPYQTFAVDDHRILATINTIEKELHRPHGGVYRYKGDVYYGGGEWLLLSAWLGWYYALSGEPRRARELLEWIEKSADSGGNMPEQVSDHPLAPKEFQPWVKRWGPVATPLLWSHAMYLILAEELS